MRYQSSRFVRSFLYFLFALFYLVVQVKAQQVLLEHIPTPTKNVMAITQDHQGFLWIAAEGLYRYDGYSFKTYIHNPKDATSLCINRIENLLVDNTGTLWIAAGGRDGCLMRYNQET